MKLQIILSEGPREGIVQLKKSIDQASIEGLEMAEIERGEHAAGQMGAGEILTSIKMIIEAAQKPLVELVKCLQKFVENYRTEIIIPVKGGEKIVLHHGRSMSVEELKDLVTAIQKEAK